MGVGELRDKLRAIGSRAWEDAFAGVNAEGPDGHVRQGPILKSKASGGGEKEGTLTDALKSCYDRACELEKQQQQSLKQATQALQKVYKGASVAYMSTVDGRLLVALDNAVPDHLVSSAREALQERAAFRRVEQSSPNADQRHMVTDHDAKLFCATPLYERIANLTQLFFSDRGFTPARIYTNAMQFGDVAHIHRDGNSEGVTALLYPNDKWDASLSGETMFFSEDEQARQAVLPKPGRLLLFVASIKQSRNSS